jgi:hypothetical protein
MTNDSPCQVDRTYYPRFVSHTAVGGGEGGGMNKLQTFRPPTLAHISSKFFFQVTFFGEE